MELVTSDREDYSDQNTQKLHVQKPPMDQSRNTRAGMIETTFLPQGGEPFRVTFTGSGIEITGRIDSAERADELVNAVNALKLLLRPVGQAKRSEEAASRPMPSASVPFMITIGQKEKLKAMGFSEERIREMAPQEAHDLLKISD